MRLKISLKVQKPTEKPTIPINYRYHISAWITDILHSSNKELSQWLAKNEFSPIDKPFDFFTFSDLNISDKKCNLNYFTLDKDVFYFTISFCPIKEIISFLEIIFQNKTIEINTTKLVVEKVEILPEPVFKEEMQFHCISPFILSYKDHTANIYTEYMYPKGERFFDLFFRSLQEKYKLCNSHIKNLPPLNETDKFHLEIINTPKSKEILTNVNLKYLTKIQGYLIDFKLKAPVDICRLNYYLGFGDENSNGFGCCEIINKDKK